MRAFKKTGNRGFTLVELMIVVAIIGVLAALAIYGVRRYLASSKTSEAKQTVGAIARGAAAAYEREVAASEDVAEGTTSTAASHSLCDTPVANAVVPAAPPEGTKYQPDTAEGADFESDDSTTGWRCLKFTITQPVYYSYAYARDGLFALSTNPNSPGGEFFSAGARGDLDGDNAEFSEFSTIGSINDTTKQLKRDTALYISQEYE